MTETSTSRRKSFAKNLTWFAIIAAFGSMLLVTVLLGVSDTRRQRWAEQEFLAISPPPEAQPIHPKFFSSTRSQVVGNSYSGSLSLQRLRTHYDSELARRGWTFESEEPAVYGWPPNRETAGTIIYYSKNGYIAHLKYLGPREAQDLKYTFDFNIEWSWLESLAWKLRR